MLLTPSGMKTTFRRKGPFNDLRRGAVHVVCNVYIVDYAHLLCTLD
jgi:hypothetical protein